MMGFIWIFVLAFMWAAMTERFTLGNLAIGFVLALIVVAVTGETAVKPDPVRAPKHSSIRTPPHLKVFKAIKFAIYFVWELLHANARVAHDVLTPTWHMRPGVIAVPLDAVSDAEITWLANLISLTPGTLSLDVSSDRTVLYVYAMFLDDQEDLIRQIKDGLEKPMLEILR
jgi:multicomponent Na+:H+ antiporter subunit E